METPPTGLRWEEPKGEDWASFTAGLDENISSSSDLGDPKISVFLEVSDLEC